MAFYASHFIFNNIPSQTYGLKLIEMNASGESTSSASNQISILQQKVFRNPVPYFYGVEQSEVLEFEITSMSETEIPSTKYSEISSWLFGKQNYGTLRIMQNDMKTAFYKCFFTEPETIKVGNMIYGFTATVVCDSPWAWKEAKTETYTIEDMVSDGDEYYSSFELYNQSANDYYTFPSSVIIRATAGGGTMSLTNVNDNDRVLQLTGLRPNEIITMNSALQLISTNKPNKRPSIINHFNLKWLRLVKGSNRIVVTGNVKSITIGYSVAYKAGG